MFDSENVSSQAQGTQADRTEIEGNSSKAGIRKWKRVARAIHQTTEQDPNPLGGLQLGSQNLIGSSQTDGKLELRDLREFEISKTPCNYGSIGSEKRKEVSISPGDFLEAKKKRDNGSEDSTFLTAEPRNQARQEK